MVELVYEIGINASGSIELAKKMIDVAYSAGAHYVKLQKRNVEVVYTKEELDAPRESPWGKTNREQKFGLEFTEGEYDEISQYCKGRIGWFASPWDLDSVEFLRKYKDCVFIKIPSALITNYSILDAAIKTEKPVIISTGMSTMQEIDNAVKTLGPSLYCIMHCTSTYPSKPEELNLNMIRTLKDMYPKKKIGFSNHNPGIIYMPVAAALGAEMIEFHGTLERSSYGSDQSSSIEPEGVHKLAKYIKGVTLAMGDGVKKVYDSEIPIIKKLRR
jgi:N-acetylneuraminate synthase